MVEVSKKSLKPFHPLIREWFLEQVGEPTDVQAQAWPVIAKGGHALITAPTGSGKTLTAFLWALNQLITGEWPEGYTSVLYVSPLKALNNDIRRNLLEPLAALKEVFDEAGERFPDIHVLTRSGDTPQSDRRRMSRHPPEILITTPESLNLMLSSQSGRCVLMNLKTVILDEIHGVVNTKRGTHLITAVERLVPLSGEFQRIALSATVNPLDKVARFVGGYALAGAEYSERPVELIESTAQKDYAVSIFTPPESQDREDDDAFWKPIVEEIKGIIRRNRSTLVFTNSRRLCEKITLKINRGEDKLLAYAHHGSLSREIRSEVESRLKAGELKAIVATNSLEMGIDIGALDEVVLLQSPPAVSSAIQRLGRAGHRVGEVSRGTVMPTHARDFIEAAVLAEGIAARDIEAVAIPENPLDVLAQVMVSMTGTESWDIDALFVQVRTSYPYRNLQREWFDRVLQMLAGRYVDSRVRELKPRVSIDALDNTVRARRGALQALYMSGGTIPDRGYFNLRHEDSSAKIGELDEEFVWEASIGQVFTLGTQHWKIQRITHNDVFVTGAKPGGMDTPFWKGEVFNRDFHFSERIGLFLEQANNELGNDDFAKTLENRFRMNTHAANELIRFLKNQKQVTHCDLPHRYHMLMEIVQSGPHGAPGNQVVLHTLWGGRVNRPLGMAIEAAWEERYDQRIEVNAENDCIVLIMPHEVDADELLSLIPVGEVERLLRQRLEGSGYFGARFRECAGRALLINRHRMNQRMPLWMSRLRSEKLMAAVLEYEDFPILLETWRTCLQDEFDMVSLRKVLEELENGTIHCSTTHTTYPSPMAQTVAWRQVNEFMYRDDTPHGKTQSKLKSDYLRDVVFTPDLRPALPEELIREFEAKRQRTRAGYAPQDGLELLDWVKERRLIPKGEWEALLEAMACDHELDVGEVVDGIANKLVLLKPFEAKESLVVALEDAAVIVQTFYADERDLKVSSITGKKAEVLSRTNDDEDEEREESFLNLVEEWLRYYGPKPPAFIRDTLGFGDVRTVQAMDDLVGAEKWIEGELVEGVEEVLVCDSENFEALLRINRARNRPVFEALELEKLPLFLAAYQGLCEPGEGSDALFGAIEQLVGLPVSAGLWESDILPARLKGYQTAWLDALMQEGELMWLGTGKEQTAFSFRDELDLLQTDNEEAEGNYKLDDVLAEAPGGIDFESLQQATALSATELTEVLWQNVWKGKVTNDTYLALRRGAQNKFKVVTSKVVPTRTRSRTRRATGRSGISQFKGSLPMMGRWHQIEKPVTEDDLLDREERNKDRVRLLLDRYGVLFRELLRRELPALNWPQLFRALRLMELSGEIVSGYFFKDIPGLQFTTSKALRMLQRTLPENRVFWLNATDPASVCGLALDGLKGGLPSRVASNHLAYKGSELAVISKRNGQDLTVLLEPDDAALSECFGFMRNLLTRQFQPLSRLTVDTINGEDAAKSAYCTLLETLFDVEVDRKSVHLYRHRM